MISWATDVLPTPNPVTTWLPALFTLVAALGGSYMVYRNARRANQISDRAALADQQLKWTQQVMVEATAAKSEARDATAAAKDAERAANAASVVADSAIRRADAAEVRLSQVSDLADKLVDWIARVVRKAHAEGVGDNASPQVAELLRVINGGPAEISSSQLQRRGQ